MARYLDTFIRLAISVTILSIVSCGKKAADKKPTGEEGATSEVEPTSVTGQIEGSGASGGAAASGARAFPSSPSVSSITLKAPESQALQEDETGYNIPFVFSDEVDLVSCMSVTAKSNSEALIDASGMIIGGTAPKCTITITPKLNAFGKARITLMATDKLSNFASASFEVSVVSVDDKPSLSKVLDQTTAKNVTLGSIGVQITDPDTTLTCSSSLKVSSSNPLILATSGIVISGNAPDCLLSLSPVYLGVGSSLITLSVGEGSMLVTDTFQFTVSQTFAKPTLIAPGVSSVKEDQTLANLAFTLTDADGGANCLDVALMTNNPSVLSSSDFVLGGSAPNCILSLTPKADQSGAVLVTLNYSDPTSLAASATFSVMVNPVNDGPTIASIGQAAIKENEDLAGHPISVLDIDTELSCTSVLTAIVSDESKVLPSDVSFSGTAPNCKMNLSPVANAYGSTSITVTISDGEFSASSSFILDIVRADTPSVPVLNSPSPTVSNSSSLELAGTCTAGLTVKLSGSVLVSEVSPNANTLSQTCVSGVFSFTIRKSVDGTYSFGLKQVNGSAESPIIFKDWTRDSLPPVAPKITNPSNLTYSSGPATLSLQGECEEDSTVILSRDNIELTPALSCISGTYNRLIEESLDGTYSYSVKQIDLAGNISSAVLLSWSVESTAPSNPVLNQSSVNYTKASAFTLSGSCSGTNKVFIQLADVDIAGSPLTCTAGTFSLSTSQLNDGVYRYSIYQQDANNDIASGSVQITWIKDAEAPSAPQVTYPASTFTSSKAMVLRATCEVGANVYIKENGTLLNAGEPTSCLDGSFYYPLTKSDSTPVVYVYSLYQLDSAQNQSHDSTMVTWNFDPLSINPVTFDSPADINFATGGDTLLVSGSCDRDLTVVISGITSQEVTAPLGKLEQTCSANLDFSFALKKLTAGMTTIEVVQKNGVSVSSPASFAWTYDNIAPSLALLTKPSSPNYFSVAEFSFTTDDAMATIECSLDSQPYTTCTSGYSNALLSNGTHTLTARSVDGVGNTSSPLSYTWLQNSYKTLALYHFSQGTDLEDQSLYADGSLTNFSTTSGTGKFGEARVFGTNTKLYTSNKTQFQASAKELTVEAWIKMSTLPTNGSWQTIVAKSKSASSGISFVLQIGKNSNKMKLQAKLSGNGSTVSTYTSGAISFSANTWYHVALTFKGGAYKIYLNGVNKKSGISATTSLFTSSSELTIGTDGTNQFVGDIDEVRMSQIQRYSSTFSPPTSPFSAD